MSCPEYVEAVNVLMGELTRALMNASEPLLGLIQQTSVDHLPDGDVTDPEATVGLMHR
jgi:hypothetical protein